MDEDLDRVRLVKEKYEDWLLSVEGVVGVGIGKSESGKLCIKTYIRQGVSLQEQLPEKLDGVDLELREVGEIIAS